MEKEIRNYDAPELRACGDKEKQEKREIEGYALVFNNLSEDLGGFREQIEPEAINGMIEKCDIMALLNHDSSRGILARSRCGKGSLCLEVDEKGLRYSFEAPKTALGDEVLEYLRRGEICQSSFAFTVAEDNWEKQGDGSYIRTIKKFDRLFDVSPVFTPAYSETSVSCARFLEVQELDKKALDEARKLTEQQEAEELIESAKRVKEYYDKMKEDLKNYLN